MVLKIYLGLALSKYSKTHKASPLTQSVKKPPAMQETVCNARDASLIPGSGRSPEEGNGNPLQYTWLGKPMDRGAWQATVHGIVKESDTT